MSKTIVSIISEQTIPNYLFIKEMFLPGDSLMFISSDKYKERIDWIVKTLDYRLPCEVVKVIFPAEGEERWLDMQEQLGNVLSKDRYYVVNLTGGTKYMSLLVQHVFEQFGNSEFAYIPYPKNCILIPGRNEALPLKYRLNVREYLSNYNVSYTEKTLTKDAFYTSVFFDKFIRGRLDFASINLLREYRNKKKTNISEAEAKSSNKFPQIPGLGTFINNIHFPIVEDGVLSSSEVQYLTGGWFEEYMYRQIEEKIHPQDIRLGVLIKRTDNHNQNHLDVVFTYGNKLFVIECKTGIDKVKMFNETVYKATAIKEAVLGLSAKTFIISLSAEDEQLKKTAQNMGISYRCREDVSNLTQLMEEIKKAAND